MSSSLLICTNDILCIFNWSPILEFTYHKSHSTIKKIKNYYLLSDYSISWMCTDFRNSLCFFYFFIIYSIIITFSILNLNQIELSYSNCSDNSISHRFVIKIYSFLSNIWFEVIILILIFNNFLINGYYMTYN